MLSHDVGAIQIAAVNHNGIFHVAAHTLKIERRKFFPLGKDEQRIRSSSGFIAVGSELDTWIEHFPGAVNCGRIIGHNLAALLYQGFNQQNRGRFPDVVGAAFEGET